MRNWLPEYDHLLFLVGVIFFLHRLKDVGIGRSDRFRRGRARVGGGKGSFTAPFEGTHGWYFRNKGDTPVTVKVRTTGFCKDLFRPMGE